MIIFFLFQRSLNAATAEKKKKRSGVEAPLSETAVAAAETSRRHSQFLLSRAAEALFKSCSTCLREQCFFFFLSPRSQGGNYREFSQWQWRADPTHVSDDRRFICILLLFSEFHYLRSRPRLVHKPFSARQSLVLATAVGTFSGRLDPLKVISRSGVSEVTVWTTLSPASSPSLLPREVSPRSFSAVAKYPAVTCSVSASLDELRKIGFSGS